MDVPTLGAHAARDVHRIMRNLDLTASDLCAAINDRFSNITNVEELTRLLNGDFEVPAKVLLALEAVLPSYRQAMYQEMAREELDDNLANVSFI